MNRCFLYLLLALQGLIICSCSNPEQIEVVNIANVQTITDQLFVVKKEAIDTIEATRYKREKYEDEFKPFIVTSSNSAKKQLPFSLEFGINPNSAPEGYMLDHLNVKWRLYPGFTLDNELASFSLVSMFEYTLEDETKAFSKFKELIKEVAKEYGSPIYEQFTELRTLDDIIGKNYLRFYDCGSYYVAHYGTDAASESFISTALLYISKDYNHYTGNRIYRQIEGLENDIAQKGLFLDIKKETILGDDRLIEFSPTKPFLEDKPIDTSSPKSYIDSFINQPNFSTDNKNLLLMLIPNSRYQEGVDMENKSKELLDDESYNN